MGRGEAGLPLVEAVEIVDVSKADRGKMRLGAGKSLRIFDWRREADDSHATGFNG
jgi:hypothetical protein